MSFSIVIKQDNEQNTYNFNEQNFVFKIVKGSNQIYDKDHYDIESLFMHKNDFMLDNFDSSINLLIINKNVDDDNLLPIISSIISGYRVIEIEYNNEILCIDFSEWLFSFKYSKFFNASCQCLSIAKTK